MGCEVEAPIQNALGSCMEKCEETIAGVHGQRLREFGQVGIQRALDNHTMTNTASQTSTTKKVIAINSEFIMVLLLHYT